MILFRNISKKLSYRASIFVLVALTSSLLAVILGPLVPDSLIGLFGDDSTDRILDVMAQSMLVVVTFSMSTLVATYAMLINSMTPRVAKLIMQDSEAQNALSLFLGSFIFSIVSIISLSTGLVDKRAKVVLFVITLLVLSSVVTTIVGWIGQLSELGQLDKIIKRIQSEIKSSLNFVLISFSSEKSQMKDDEFDSVSFEKDTCGYLQSIDAKRLEEIADESNTFLKLRVCPGDFISQDLPILEINDLSKIDQDTRESLLSCFTIGSSRTFDEDPMYGIEVLSEIGCKALSPGINDPGSAIRIVAAQVETLSMVNHSEAFKRDISSEQRVFPKVIDLETLFSVAFSTISRDGAHFIEVGDSLNRALTALSKRDGFIEPARSLSIEVIERFTKGLNDSPDMHRLEKWKKIGSY